MHLGMHTQIGCRSGWVPAKPDSTKPKYIEFGIYIIRLDFMIPGINFIMVGFSFRYEVLNTQFQLYIFVISSFNLLIILDN